MDQGQRSASACRARYGVSAALQQEWIRSQPGLVERLDAARSQATAKGWRWTAEMRENARAFDAAGQPPGFGEASAEVYERYRRPGAT